MNKRELQKHKTGQLIIREAKKLFLQNGFLKTTTSEIAKACGIAHGTLFLHYPTKDSLIISIFDKDMELISEKMQALISETSNLEDILQGYLSIVEKDENLFSILARELPEYPTELRRKLLFRESLIRQHFHQAFSDGIQAGKYRDCNIPITLNFFFGSLNYYLSLKEVFQENGSVIKRFRGELIDNFIKLISKDNKRINQEVE